MVRWWKTSPPLYPSSPFHSLFRVNERSDSTYSTVLCSQEPSRHRGPKQPIYERLFVRLRQHWHALSTLIKTAAWPLPWRVTWAEEVIWTCQRLNKERNLSHACCRHHSSFFLPYRSSTPRVCDQATDLSHAPNQDQIFGAGTGVIPLNSIAMFVSPRLPVSTFPDLATCLLHFPPLCCSAGGWCTELHPAWCQLCLLPA